LGTLRYDAARYLHVAPPNIGIRRRIREAGVQLLKKLHSCSQYDRILVVGHSLGSVIGYDILTHLWPSYHDDHVTVPRNRRDYSALHKLEELTRQALTGSLDVDGYQAAQSEYLTELQTQGNEWLVTDFVTLGSPLAHASVLVARNGQEFKRKKDEREFPVCPPVLDEEGRFSFGSNSIWAPHHAAVFAPTRWTNLYFPCRYTLWGDLIGGPLATPFGRGIRDIVVETNLRAGIFSHTLYWTFPAQRRWRLLVLLRLLCCRPSTSRGLDEDVPSWIGRLREAVKICQDPKSAGERSQ
jgi:hypothetical protein